MTNDFSVEQQRKPSAFPYVATGIAAGGALGYAKLPKWTGKVKSHEDIVKEMEDKDAFTKNTAEGAPQAAEWKDVQAKANEVKDAEKALEEASKPKLPEGMKESSDLKIARDNMQREIDRLQAIENGKVKSSAGVSYGAYDPAKLPKFKDLGIEELPSTYAKSGKKIKPTNVESLYNDMVKNAIDARKDLNDALIAPNGLKTKQNKFVSSLISNNASYSSALAGKGEDKIAQYFSDTVRYDALGNKTYSPQFQKAMDAVTPHYPLPVQLAEEEVRSIGQVVDAKTATAPGMSRKSFKIPKESGRGYTTEWIEYDGKAYRELLAQKQAEVLSTRENVANQILSEAQNTFRLNQDKANLSKTFGDNVERTLCEKTGLYNAKKDLLDMAKIIDPANSGAYKADIKSIQDSLHNVTKNPYDAKVISKYTTVAGKTPTKAEAQKALEALNARNRVFTQYERELKALDGQINESLHANDIFKDYETKIADFVSKHEPTQKADKALQEQFPNVINKTTTSSSEVAKTISEADVKQELRDALKNAEEKYAEAAKKSGKIDEAAKKAAEEALESKRNALKEASEGLSKKLGKAGMNKWVGLAIGAAALGIAGMAIAPKKSKQA